MRGNITAFGNKSIENAESGFSKSLPVESRAAESESKCRMKAVEAAEAYLGGNPDVKPIGYPNRSNAFKTGRYLR